MCIEVLYDNN